MPLSCQVKLSCCVCGELTTLGMLISKAMQLQAESCEFKLSYCLQRIDNAGNPIIESYATASRESCESGDYALLQKLSDCVIGFTRLVNALYMRTAGGSPGFQCRFCKQLLVGTRKSRVGQNSGLLIRRYREGQAQEAAIVKRMWSTALASALFSLHGHH
jgi:hypothetical protein